MVLELVVIGESLSAHVTLDHLLLTGLIEDDLLGHRLLLLDAELFRHKSRRGSVYTIMGSGHTVMVQDVAWVEFIFFITELFVVSAVVAGSHRYLLGFVQVNPFGAIRTLCTLLLC